MKKPIFPTESASAGFGIFLIVITQLLATAYIVYFFSIPSVFVAVSISLSGWISGLVLVALSKCRQELGCIRQLLNEEYGRINTKESKPSPEESRVVAWKE